MAQPAPDRCPQIGSLLRVGGLPFSLAFVGGIYKSEPISLGCSTGSRRSGLSFFGEFSFGDTSHIVHLLGWIGLEQLSRVRPLQPPLAVVRSDDHGHSVVKLGDKPVCEWL